MAGRIALVASLALAALALDIARQGPGLATRATAVNDPHSLVQAAKPTSSDERDSLTLPAESNAPSVPPDEQAAADDAQTEDTDDAQAEASNSQAEATELALIQIPGAGALGVDTTQPINNLSPEGRKVLRVNPERFINLLVIVVWAVVGLLTAIGLYVERRGPSKKGLREGVRQSSVGGWVVCMLVASYIVLIPGLFSKDFSFNIAVNVDLKAFGLDKNLEQLVHAFVPNLPSRIQVTQPRGQYGPIHESTRTFVGFLWQSNAHKGAVLVAIFAFAVPGLKLVLLSIGLLLRESKSYACVMVSRWVIIFVQLISKWAGPDMVALILLYYLFRGLNHPPLLESLQVLDVGFTFYGTYCIFSVISTMFIKPPRWQEPGELELQPEAPFLQRLVGRRAVQALAVGFFVAWLIFFVHGLNSPILTLRLDQQVILAQAHIPNNLLKMAQPFIDKLNLAGMVSDDVSLLKCVRSYMTWFTHSGSLNLLLAWFMLLGLVVVNTILSMACLLVAALRLAGDREKPRQCPAMSLCFVLRHLAWLDVLVVGVVVMSMAAVLYKEQGIIIETGKGIVPLAISEGLHYGMYLAVAGGFEH